MSTRIGRISYILTAVVVLAALIAGCQPAATATATAATPAGSSPTQANANPKTANQAVPPTPSSLPADYPGASTAPTSEVVIGYPGDMQAGQQPTSAAVMENYPGPGPAGVPAMLNEANVVAQLLEQHKGDTADQLVLHVKLLSATPKSGTDFVTQLVNTEVDLVASTADVPQLAANDQFEAVVSLLGDEHGQQYSVKEIKKK